MLEDVNDPHMVGYWDLLWLADGKISYGSLWEDVAV